MGVTPHEREDTGLHALLPHGPAFRFVDRVVRCDRGVGATALWTPRGDEPWLEAHFPGHPIVPGVILVEAMAQTGAVALLADPRYADRLPLFGGAEDVRFRRPVHPHDEVRLEVEVERMGGIGGWGRGRAEVDGSLVAHGRILFVLTRPDDAADAGEAAR